MDEGHTALQIKIINDRLEKEANNSLREKKLTSVQMHVLMLLLREEEQTMPLKEVERRLHVAQPTAAGIVVRLEQKGFLESLPCPDDRRIKLLHLTEAGERQCRECISHAQEAERRVRDALTEEEYKKLEAILDKVILSLGIIPYEACGKEGGQCCRMKEETCGKAKKKKGSVTGGGMIC